MTKSVFIFAALVTLTFGYPQSNNLGVYNGEVVDITERPYMAAILDEGNLSCGGIIISKNTILTGAHCVTHYANRWSVRVGSVKHSEGGQILNVTNVKFPEYWNPYANDYDLALLTLNGSVSHVNASVIKLVGKDFSISENDELELTGWGAEQVNSRKWSETLKTAKITVIPSTECKKAYNVQFNDSSMFCAGKGAGACTADTGGPVVKNGLLVGVVSFNFGCGREGYPGAYLKVSYFRDWILQNMS